MRPLLVLAACACALAACKEEAPPAPTRPPGEVYGAPQGQYMFVRPPFWQRQVLPVSEPPTLEGATSMVKWNLNATSEQPPRLLTLWTFSPEAWAPYAAADSAVGEVVFQDDRRVVVATGADANPYAEADTGYVHYNRLVIPFDSVRARIIVR